MGRLLRYLIMLAVLGLIALAVYAQFGDLRPVQSEITVPVTLDENAQG